MLFFIQEFSAILSQFYSENSFAPEKDKVKFFFIFFDERDINNF